jgi:hypothetical protein
MDMPTEAIEYTFVLRDLRQRKATLEAEVSKLEVAISAIEDLVGPLTPVSGTEIGTSIKPLDEGQSTPLIGPYTGKTIVAATTDFLRTAGKPQHISNILTALKRGGIHSNSKNLYRTVYNTLNTNLEKELSRTHEGLWGLKEWDQK